MLEATFIKRSFSPSIFWFSKVYEQYESFKLLHFSGLVGSDISNPAFFRCKNTNLKEIRREKEIVMQEKSILVVNVLLSMEPIMGVAESVSIR